ncbi:MAG: ABC transporter ATP-binding protein [Anaerolineae bacterium]|nr:ABC transporter ATP-binding protein [Anaerolineae bacterium]MCO5193445.1 ABC transporter ATP-binding protein [Anaerolineae bacterium]MCO5198936.1 ABC transporter ATP-binding protein [Anaerolineae bacterium]
MSDAVVTLSDLRFAWNKHEDDLLYIPYLSVERGEHLLLRGASGSGKTTLLNLLTGIHQPTSGSVTIIGTRLDEFNQRARDQFRADHLGVIFQQFNLLPYLSIAENVVLPCWFSHRRREKAGNPREQAKQLLEALNVPSALLTKQAGKLSVGQQQRVAVARALIGGPEIVIADEPTSALDADNRSRFLELLFREADQQGCTLIFVSHDAHLADQFSRVVEMDVINEAARAAVSRQELAKT